MKAINRTNIPPNSLGRIGGVLYLFIVVCGLFTEFFVRSSLIVPGDAGATAGNILAQQGLYRLGFVSDLIMLLCDLALALVLFELLKPVSQTLALGAVATRLVMDAILGINLLNHFYALLLLNGAEYLMAFEPTQLHALVSVTLEAQSIGYAIGLVFFAFHCLILAYLFYRSEYFPKIFGLLLGFAFASYLVDSLARFLVSGYDTANYWFIMLPALIAEVSLCLWLLVKGTRSRSPLSTQIQPRSNRVSISNEQLA